MVPIDFIFHFTSPKLVLTGLIIVITGNILAFSRRDIGRFRPVLVLIGLILVM